MAAPLPTSKQSVNLASGEVRISRIRRDPPPREKPKPEVDLDEIDRRGAVLGIAVIALAIVVILFAIGMYGGWSPSQYNVQV
nr:hypothetical protein [uncultured Sphingomonas sp.]